jgi:hypothetical protein
VIEAKLLTVIDGIFFVPERNAELRNSGMHGGADVSSTADGIGVIAPTVQSGAMHNAA